MLQAMFSRMFVVKVRIAAALVVTRADPTWFVRFVDEPNEEFAEAYWRGEQHHGSDDWEYLVEGEIELTDGAQLNYVREQGAHRQYLVGQ